MILRVRKIDGQEALNIGLVHSVYPVAELKNAAMALARELASRPPLRWRSAGLCRWLGAQTVATGVG